MDGFHLAQAELVRLGRRDRMGAPDTFDAAGYAALLEPPQRPTSRSSTRPSSGARSRSRSPARSRCRSDVPLVVTEGNYLLLWPDAITPLLDETWYVETDEELRVQRLIQRHIQFGKTPEYARAWVMRSDERNAELVARDRARPPTSSSAYSFSSWRCCRRRRRSTGR